MENNRILVVTPSPNESWTWLSHHFAPGRYRWTFLRADAVHKGRSALIPHAFKAARSARQHDLVVTFGPWLTLFTATFMLALRVRRPHLAFTFNHGNGRFFSGPFLALARMVLPTVSAFVTHSRYERSLLGKKYGIPERKMLFTHWAVAVPETGRRSVDYVPDGQYVCCIGRNNRDLLTFVEAVRKTDIEAILICNPGQAEGLDLPNTVTLRTDVPVAECQEVMDRAMATVVPLVDDTTGAGHMTIVASLLCGTPVIATDSPVLSDYVIEDRTGALVERGSSDALAAAIKRLQRDPELRDRLRASSRAFAMEHLTEASAAEFCRRTLEDFLPRGPQS